MSTPTPVQERDDNTAGQRGAVNQGNRENARVPDSADMCNSLSVYVQFC